MYLSQQPFSGSAQFGPSLTNSYDERKRTDGPIQIPEGSSRLRSPIPPDPGYGVDTRVPNASRGSGYVLRLHGSDAKTIYKRATACEGAPFLLNLQYSDIFHQSNNAGKPLKNHLNENCKRIRRIMRESQKRQTIKSQSQPTPVKALWHSKQYDQVESKVKQKLAEDFQRSSSRPQSTQGNYLRAHANTGPEILRSQSVSNSRRSSVASSVDLPIKKIDDKTKPDYVKINSQYAKNIPKVRKTVSTEAVEQVRQKQEKDLKKYQENQKGRLPDYIEKIKEKRDEDIYQARINAPDPECPRGHIKVDNAQRLNTLQQLKSNRTELEKKLLHLPIRTDTLTLQRTKGDIEKKITELDEAIEIFSKPKVFIKIDE